VGKKNFEVTQLISHAQLMVSLELVAVASATDTLKVFSAVWIASS